MTMITITIIVTAILIKKREKYQEGLPPPRYQALSCMAIQEDMFISMRSV